MKLMDEISDYLITRHGFRLIRKPIEPEEIDYDKYDVSLNVKEKYHVFYSGEHKHFSIGLKHVNPKKRNTSGFKQHWTTVVIPRIIRSKKDADIFVDWLIENK